MHLFMTKTQTCCKEIIKTCLHVCLCGFIRAPVWTTETQQMERQPQHLEWCSSVIQMTIRMVSPDMSGGTQMVSSAGVKPMRVLQRSGPQRYTEAFSVYICFCISLTHLQHLNIWSVSPVHSKLNKLTLQIQSKLHVIVLCTPDFTGQLSHSHLSGKLCARLVWVKMHWKYLKNKISVWV